MLGTPLDKAQFDMLQHALGYNYEPRRVRNWVGVDVGSDDHQVVLGLVGRGLMEELGDVGFSTSRSYRVTEAGHELVRKSMPKRSRGQERYLRYLRLDVPDLTFIEFCKHEKEYR